MTQINTGRNIKNSGFRKAQTRKTDLESLIPLTKAKILGML